MEYATIWCIEHEYREQSGCRMAEKLIYHYIVLQSSGKCFELKKKMSVQADIMPTYFFWHVVIISRSILP